MAALAAGDRYQVEDFYGTGQDLVIEACSSLLGNWNTADSVTLSIGKGRSICGEKPVQEAAEKETEAPVEEKPKQTLADWILAWIRRRRQSRSAALP